MLAAIAVATSILSLLTTGMGLYWNTRQGRLRELQIQKLLGELEKADKEDLIRKPSTRELQAYGVHGKVQGVSTFATLIWVAVVIGPVMAGSVALYLSDSESRFTDIKREVSEMQTGVQASSGNLNEIRRELSEFRDVISNQINSELDKASLYEKELYQATGDNKQRLMKLEGKFNQFLRAVGDYSRATAGTNGDRARRQMGSNLPNLITPEKKE